MEAHQDPLAADRRTLVVAAVAMVVLVAVGVVSASVFTGSACDRLQPEAIPSSDPGLGAREVFASAFEEADEATLDAIEGSVTTLAGEFGALTGAVDVSGADRLTGMPLGAAAVGERAFRLGEGGDTVVAAADVGGGTVVGDGGALYSLAIGNEVTGQVDAVMPLDARLTGGECVDTAVVGTPFAFHLDAGGGQLLLFRVEEDGTSPELELRDGATGRVWASEVEVETAPPGVLGERLDGRLDSESVVLTARSVPGQGSPVIAVFERSSGELRWALDRDDLDPAVDGGPQSVEVIAVGAGLVVVELRAEDDDPGEAGPAAAVTVAVETADGTVAWVAEQPTSYEATLDSRLTASGELLTLVRHDSGIAVQSVGTSGRTTVLTASDVASGRLVAHPDGGTALVTPRRAVMAGVESVLADFGPLEARDVVEIGDATTWLFEGPGDGAVALTFGG